MNKLEVGMFIRTDDGKINKFKRYITDKKRVCETDMYTMLAVDNIVKASFNIIDLIEVGDYVNGSEVLDFEYKLIKENDNFTNFAVVTENCYLENTDSWIIEKNIKSVITHEQIEQMEYRIGGK